MCARMMEWKKKTIRKENFSRKRDRRLHDDFGEGYYNIYLYLLYRRVQTGNDPCPTYVKIIRIEYIYIRKYNINYIILYHVLNT